ncbi:fibronectin type III domain-containing protein [Parapedobacter sp. 2B3]|uniref:fibronectin type III domain-containing protein n=1 Tax=Parapedobacter sp. 2B3 TaxID=3342381 RepID=UPI0035B58EA8
MAKPIFTSKDAAGLLRYAEHIFLKMTENADLFPAPIPDLTALESSITAYRDAFAEATFRDKRAVILKKQRGQELQEAVYRLSHYVDAVAQGDPATILAAGYDVGQPSTNRVGHTPKAENLRVEHVQVGTGILLLKVKPWKPARLYRYEYRKAGSESWDGLLYSKSTLQLSGLDMLQEYEFRVSYISRDTTLNFSDITKAIVV